MSSEINDEIKRMILSGQIKLRIKKKRLSSPNRLYEKSGEVLVLSVDGIEQTIGDGVMLEKTTWD